MAIMLNENYRIVKIDKRNYTFERLQDVKKKNDDVKKEWVQVGGYYDDLARTCKALKDYIVQDNVDETTDVYGLIKLLTDIQAHYQAITFKVVERE